MQYLNVAIFLVALLPLLAVGRSTSPPDKDEVTIKQYWNFILSSTTLRYGEACSWDDEVARQDEIRKTENLQPRSSLRKELFDQFVKDSLSKNRTFCTSLNKLVCDQETQTCVCGEASSQVGLGDRYKSSSYVLEQGKDGQKVCRWGASTACYPQRRVFSKETSAILATDGFTEPRCASGLRCVAVQTGTPCTNTTFIDYVLQHLGKNALPFDQIKDNLLTGKVCACQDKESLVGNDDSNNFEDSQSRNKRSLGHDNSFYEQAVSAWAPHINI